MADLGADFGGLRVLALESRRADEIARLITNNRGAATVAPSMREAPLESNTAALDFAARLLGGGFDLVIFLTGVGTRALTRVIESAYPREQFVEALRGVTVAARGPKPIAALRELDVPVTVAAPEPNTWRELLQALDAWGSLQDLRVAVQEYGVSNPELLAELAGRGAQVTAVPVYQWALPEDTAPLRAAVKSLARGEEDVVLYTTSIQVTHLLQIAAGMSLEEPLRRAFERVLIASIGPTTSEALREHGLEPDLEPSHPKMGYLVLETARRAAEILAQKRARANVQASQKSLPR